MCPIGVVTEATLAVATGSRELPGDRLLRLLPGVQVELGRRDGRVAEELLHAVDVTVGGLERGGRVGVAGGVRLAVGDAGVADQPLPPLVEPRCPIGRSG